MKQYYGNYLGMCISSDDPEQRGRVQIFIPHIMPTLYEGWNEDGKDHSFVGLGDNIQNGLPSEVIDKLRKILPWAEAASPIIGASSPGTLTRSAAAISSAASAVATETTSLLGKLGKWLLNQSPTSTPSTPQSKNGTSQPIETTSTSGTENVANPNVLYKANPVENNPPSSNNYGTPDNKLSTSSNANATTVGINSTYIKPGATIFGYKDSLDNGVGAWGTPTNNTTTVGVSLPVSVLKSVFGNADDAKGKLVEVYNPDTGKTVLAPIVDKGPATNVSNGLDNTAGTVLALGGTITYDSKGNATGTKGIENTSYRILSPDEQTKYSQFSQNGGNIDGPLGDVSNTVDLRAGTNDYKQVNGIDPIIGGVRPDYPKSSTNLVNKTDPHGPTASYNLNDTAKGMFSYPLPGAMLWVFFQDGNPLFPVYFAANYGAAEWKSAYKYNSPGHAYTPDANGNNPATSVGGVMNLGAGVMSWATTNHPENFTKSEQSFYIGHDDGSNMYFVKGYHQLYSKFDRRDQVDGNRYNSTLGYKEEWVQGDSNQVIMGDSIIKVGNCSQAAVDAALKIQQLGCEIYKPITDKKVSK